MQEIHCLNKRQKELNVLEGRGGVGVQSSRPQRHNKRKFPNLKSSRSLVQGHKISRYVSTGLYKWDKPDNHCFLGWGDKRYVQHNKNAILNLKAMDGGIYSSTGGILKI